PPRRPGPRSRGPEAPPRSARDWRQAPCGPATRLGSNRRAGAELTVKVVTPAVGGAAGRDAAREFLSPNAHRFEAEAAHDGGGRGAAVRRAGAELTRKIRPTAVRGAARRDAAG